MKILTSIKTIIACSTNDTLWRCMNLKQKLKLAWPNLDECILHDNALLT